MAIKKLQNNYTTLKQSKRLLELGLPADSADCYYDSWKQIQLRQLADLHNDFFDVYKHYTPCWSVGQLMEIFELCNLYELHKFATRDWSVNIKKLMRDYEVAAEENMLDFSKLEE